MRTSELHSKGYPGNGGLALRTLTKAAKPFVEFARMEASGGILLFLATVAAMVWANSASSASYVALFETPLGIHVAEATLTKPALMWINDGLMAVFFFLVGLEIKREITHGDLASPRQAILPAAAALGGIVLPASIYLAFNAGTPDASGWGVPMATDIAFALGVMALLGSRVPTALKLFLTVLAIVDDLAAVLVIAVFYSKKLDLTSLFLSLGLWVAVMLAARAGMRSLWAFFVPGVLVWFFGLLSGVHATIAGVMMAFAIPAHAASPDEPSPLETLEHALHPWVAYAILPLFAFANAGVTIPSGVFALLQQPLSLGVIFGLLLGKPIGIVLTSWLAVRSGAADLPQDSTWTHIVGAGFLAGIGFTMSLFIASLAASDTATLDAFKLAILVASVTAGLIGSAILARHHAKKAS